MDRKVFVLLVLTFGEAIDKSVAKIPQPQGKPNIEGVIQDNKGTKNPLVICPKDKGQCGQGYTLSLDGSTCYKLNGELLTHDQSEEVCVKEGGHLLVVNSEAERDAIKALMKVGAKTLYTRVGFRKINEDWMTVTGQTLDQAGYTKWKNGEPDGVNKSEECGGIQRGPVLLSDIDCKAKKYNFICEKNFICDNDLIETPQTEGNPNIEGVNKDNKVTKNPTICPKDKRECGQGYTLSFDGSTCHKLNGELLTHDQSEEVCVNEGGHLLVVNSEAERDAIKALMKVGAKTLYTRVGFRKINGDWITVTGQTLDQAGYTKWKSGEPNGVNKSEECGGIQRGPILLSDIDCKAKKYNFICEKNFICENDKDFKDCEIWKQKGKKENEACDKTYPYICNNPILNVQRDCGMAKGYTLFLSTLSCYKLHSDLLTHDQSEEVCEKEGGHLLVINSEAERVEIKAFLKTVSSKPPFTRIGFRKEDGKCETYKGQSLKEAGFNKWKYGEPNNFKGNEECGGIQRSTALLNDIQCNGKKYNFICEKELQCVVAESK